MQNRIKPLCQYMLAALVGATTPLVPLYFMGMAMGSMQQTDDRLSQIITDQRTGCEYLVFKNTMTLRLDANQQPICQP